MPPLARQPRFRYAPCRIEPCVLVSWNAPASLTCWHLKPRPADLWAPQRAARHASGRLLSPIIPRSTCCCAPSLFLSNASAEISRQISNLLLSQAKAQGSAPHARCSEMHHTYGSYVCNVQLQRCMCRLSTPTALMVHCTSIEKPPASITRVRKRAASWLRICEEGVPSALRTPHAGVAQYEPTTSRAPSIDSLDCPE